MNDESLTVSNASMSPEIASKISPSATRDATIGSQSEPVPELSAFGIRAFTTTRQSGSFGLATDEPVRVVMERWARLRREVSSATGRLASVTQTHGNTVIVNQPGWRGWLRGPDADGQASLERGTALVVTVADCVPVFIAHPSGAVALLHSGWRGTAARIVERGIDVFERHGLRANDLVLHAGPAICGRCYEVSPDVYGQLTGHRSDGPITVDLRTLILDHARARGVSRVSASEACTRCNNDRFYSHRAGDAGRQLGVIVAEL